MKSALIVSLMIFTGCAHNLVMQKAGISDEQVRRDDAACRAQALGTQSGDYAYRGTIFEGASIASQQVEIFKYCMIAKGYSERQ